ncbi:hypothetical protein SELMODRAFT_419034 [Selaginella moellendorffii]|uniref:Uncharacterized protein n=1 Tax=Selaginella moellendorffii TaxID=88036 RepID=D8S7L7_SELML|nr:hypothetical protein SELMODRAFT_419034 [Selaginella moellendorffii]
MERDRFVNYKLPYPSQIKGNLCGAAGGILFFKERTDNTISAWNPVTGFTKEIEPPSLDAEFLVIATPMSHRLCKLNSSLKLEAVDDAPPAQEWTGMCYLGDRFNHDSGIRLECSTRLMYSHVLDTCSLQALDVLEAHILPRAIGVPRPVKGRSFHLPPSTGSVKYRFFQLEHDVLACVSMEKRLHFEGCVRIWLYTPNKKRTKMGTCPACRATRMSQGRVDLEQPFCACKSNENWEDVSRLPDKYVHGLMAQGGGCSWFAFGMGNVVLVAFVSTSGDLSACNDVFCFKLASRDWSRVANPFRRSRGVNWNNMSSWYPSYYNLDMI